MSVTGVWVVGAVPDAAIGRIRCAYPGAAAAHGAVPDQSADMVWWQRQSESEVFFEEVPYWPSPTDAALRFADLVRRHPKRLRRGRGYEGRPPPAGPTAGG
jgi:hypothetical protein